MDKRRQLRNLPQLRHFVMPTLTYYLKLIELPNLELDTYIRQMLETNPLLEEIPQETASESEKEENNVSETDELDLKDLFNDDTGEIYETRPDSFDPLENIPAQVDPLYEHLMHQARMKFNDQDLKIAELVISNIEDDGYLAVEPEQLVREGFELNDINRIIRTIQNFEPVGCAWRDKREPLFIQLKALGYGEDSVEYILVRDYLSEIKSKHYKEIIKKLGITEERFENARRVILKLDPKPGWRYSSLPSRYISPDFIIYWQDNRLQAILKDDIAPRVRIRRQYIEILKNPKGIPKEQLEFIKSHAQAAQNLVVAIEQRRRTLNRIIQAILEYQYEFFEKGYNFLKPITMTEFARQLEVNPSTISRAIANKYLESPQGIHKLKFFFNAPLGHTDKRKIFQKIKEIVEAEDKTSPLSDTQIAKKLCREGIIISRRTVSKYRDLLGIPSNKFRRD